eukprot:Nk52_evm29s1020 gene=Nk52_evmTU29s1020
MTVEVMSDPKFLPFAIVEFLSEQRKTVSEEAAESLEVAVQCIQEAYDFSMDDEECVSKYSTKPHGLEEIFAKALAACPKASTAAAQVEPIKVSAAKDVEAANAKKVEGNEFMKIGQYENAVRSYTDAIQIDNTNHIYFSNRAAAYTNLKKYEQAIADCEKSIKLDSSYSKAYSRMGMAYFSLGEYEKAKEAYKQALDLEPTNSAYQANMKSVEEQLGVSQGPAAGAGPGGMPNMGGLDLGSLMSDPNIMNMAAQFMQQPGMSDLAANLMGGGAPNAGAGAGAPPAPQEGGAQGAPGGMPDLGGLMNNPALAQMAQQFAQQNPDAMNNLRNRFGGPPPSAEGNNDSQM